MMPINQTIFGAWGNCLPACVASILELDLEDVPFLFHNPDELTSGIYVPQVERLDAWLRPLGLCASEWRLSHATPPEDDFYVLCGFSPRGRGHVVVARGAAPLVVHDPHPSRAGLVSADAFMVITFS
jgi:hypothetical protein